MDTHRLIIESAEEYHAKAKLGFYLSSHLLADFRRSPALFSKKMRGEIIEPESTAFAIGRAAHALVMEGKKSFDAQYVVSDGPINPKTGEPYGKTTQAFLNWRMEQSREVISNRDYNAILKLQKSVWTHQEASQLIQGSEAEGVVRAEYCGVPCQIRMDAYHPAHGIIDFKTCEELRYFEADARRYGYVYQMAFYRAVLREYCGETAAVHMIAAEKSEPNATGVWLLTPEVLDEAEVVNRATIERLKAAKISGIYPTGYEELRIMNQL